MINIHILWVFSHKAIRSEFTDMDIAYIQWRLKKKVDINNN